MDRGLDADLAVKMKDGGKDDALAPRRATRRRDSGETGGAHGALLRSDAARCSAASPSRLAPAQAPPGTGDSGRYGGNMDFNEIVEGTTIYLRVSVPGALLYVGDGHAVQGDGELNGNALETSMDVEFTVDVIPGPHTEGRGWRPPRTCMAMGLDGSLDGAFRDATANMAQWLGGRLQADPLGGGAGPRDRGGVQDQRGRRPQRRHRAQDQQGAPENPDPAGEVTRWDGRDLTRLARSDKVRPLPRGGAAW